MALGSAVACAAFVFLRRTSIETKPPLSGPGDSPYLTRIGGLEIERLDPPPDSIRSVPPGQAREFVDAIYRVEPDRRLLYGIAEVRRILGGKVEGRLTLRFQEGRWHVRLGKDEVGSLPRVPRYADLRALLRTWTASESGRARSGPPQGAQRAIAPSIERSLREGSAQEVLGALAWLNDEWRKAPRDPGLYVLAAHGYAWLGLQTLDELKLGDPILGRAWAFVALAEQTGRAETVRADEVLLASLLGYEEAATALAESLPAGDPVRAHAMRERPWPGATPEEPRSARSELLVLHRLARLQRHTDLAAALERSSWSRSSALTMTPLILAIEAEDFKTVFEAAGQLEGEILREVLGRAADPTSAAPEARLAEFDAALPGYASRLQGPVLDAGTIEAFYQAAVYTSVYLRCRFLLDSLSVDEPAGEFAASIASTAPGPGSDLRRWALDRLAFRRNEPGSGKRVAEDMRGLRFIGTVPVARLRMSLNLGTVSGDDLGARKPMRWLFERFDSRPSDLVEAGRAAWENLLDLKLTERYFGAVAAEAPALMDWSLVDFARLSNDPGLLRATMSDTRLNGRVRGIALGEMLEAKAISAVEARAALEQINREDPERTEALLLVMKQMAAEGDLEGIARVVDQWSGLREGRRDLSWARVETAHARHLREAGRLAEASQVIEPCVRTWKGESLREAFFILVAQERLDAALELATRYEERYPGGGHGAELRAEVLWRQGKSDEAAAVCVEDNGLEAPDWASTFGPAFGRAFRKSSPAAAERAFRAVLAREPNTIKVSTLATSNWDNPRLASRLLVLAAPRPTSAETMMAYEQIEKAKGHAEALAWLLEKFPSPNLNTAVLVFSFRRDELLWDMPFDAETLKQRHHLRLYRVAALIRGRSEDAARWEEERRHFREAPPVNEYVVYGRYLAGLASETELLAAKRHDNLCWAGWLLALNRASRGLYEEASDWLQVSVEAAEEKSVAKPWAFNILSTWKDQNRFLEGVAKRGRF